MTNANDLPAKMATTEQFERLKAIVREKNPDFDITHIYAVLCGQLSVGVSEDAMERIIYLNTI